MRLTRPDASPAEALLTDLLAEAADRATLLITHDPVGLEAADEVVRLERGRVVARQRRAEAVADPSPAGAPAG